MTLFSKFKNNLQKTSNFLSSNILNSFQSKKVDSDTLEELESVLISADISLDVVEKLINSVRKVKISDQDITTTVLETLAKEIEIILSPNNFRAWDIIKKEWVIRKGSYKVYIGSSSEDIHLSEHIKL